MNVFPSVQFIKATLAFFIPPASLLFLFVFWKARSCFNTNTRDLRLNLTLSVVVVLFMVYPSLIIMFFDLFNCYEIKQGESWLINDLQLRCWTYDHLIWALLIGIPAIIFWVIGIPFIGFRVLRRQRDTL